MLPRIKDLMLRPRSGVVALGAVAALSFPAVASAAPATVTFNNSATASSQTDGRNVFILKYQAEETATSTLNAKNQAQASASHCRNCAASGIAFQVIFVSKKNAITINADNEANATTGASCVNCTTLAAAYQIIYAASQPGLSLYQIQGLNHVHSELIALQFTGLTGAKLQARTDAIAQEAVGVLNNGPNPIPVITPAINNTGNPSELTENNGPFIDLLIKAQHQG
jgi:hypothetical protein